MPQVPIHQLTQRIFSFIFNTQVLGVGFFLLFCACSSKPILPDKKSVEVSREPAEKSCRELGPIYGKTLQTTGKLEELALEDLKSNAASKGANYIYLQEYSGIGSSVKGIAYDCP